MSKSEKRRQSKINKRNLRNKNGKKKMKEDVMVLKTDELLPVVKNCLVVEWNNLLSGFLEHKHKMTNKQFCELLSNIWVDADYPSIHMSSWLELFESARTNKNLLMDEDGLKMYNELPEVVKIYRGVDDEEGVKGMSWTTDKERGEWFARRFDCGEGNSKLCITSIQKEKILMCVGGGESEVVCNPKDLGGIIIDDVEPLTDEI